MIPLSPCFVTVSFNFFEAVLHIWNGAMHSNATLYQWAGRRQESTELSTTSEKGEKMIHLITVQ